MKQVIRFSLSPDSISDAMAKVERHKIWMEQKSKELVERLATMGATHASLEFSRAVYTGINDASISVEPVKNGFKVIANGESVLFIEFGSGITYGYGHPEAGQYGMGMGTYPSEKGHWDDPKGWRLPRDKGGGHTYGNPPAMPMYSARKTIEQEIERIVREVFA